MAGILVEHKLRPCYIDRSSKKKVQKEKALFHGWSRISNVVEPSLMIGGAPGGTISYTTGIVEFEDGHVEAQGVIAPLHQLVGLLVLHRISKVHMV